MSFRLFIYYCAISGAWAALFGWVFGRLTAPEEGYGRTAVLAMFLAVCVALALSAIDGLWMTAGRFRPHLLVRILVVMAIGCMAGLVGGIIGQFFVNEFSLGLFVVFGWTLTGFLIGGSLGVYDILARLLRREAARGALRKTINGVIGGTIGGLVGGVLHLAVRSFLGTVFAKNPDELWSSSAIGYVALGACIGLLIGLAQVVLKEAWIRVEAGFRPGRELILTKPVITIGRAEGCDIGLFGATGVDKIHARIVQQGSDYYVADAQTQQGTYVNGRRIDQPARLNNGDRIRLGNCVLLFQERRKQTTATA